MTVAVYFCKPGDSNEELRYSLRSLDRHARPDEVWIVGYTPTWVQNVTSVRGNRYPDKEWAVRDNVLIIAEHPDLPDDVLVMNDDFALMRPYTFVSEHRGPLREQIGQLNNSGSWWGRSLCTTLDWLESVGHPDPLSYELHKPLMVNRAKMAGALHRSEAVFPIPQWRTVYGVLNEIPAVLGEDCKVRQPEEPFDKKAPLLSTDDRAFAQGAVGEFIRSKFNKPCKYERGE